jgi:hypothetical protein
VKNDLYLVQIPKDSVAEAEADSLGASTPTDESSGRVTPIDELDIELFSAHKNDSEASLTPSSESSGWRWRLRLSASKDSLVQAFARRAKRGPVEAASSEARFPVTLFCPFSDDFHRVK